jgi:hypothetical protein
MYGDLLTWQFKAESNHLLDGFYPHHAIPYVYFDQNGNIMKCVNLEHENSHFHIFFIKLLTCSSLSGYSFG